MKLDYTPEDELEWEREWNEVKELARSEREQRGRWGKIRMQGVAVGNRCGSELRFELTIPNAERIVSADDLGVLVQLFARTITGLEMDLPRREPLFLSSSWYAISLKCKLLLDRIRYRLGSFLD